MLEYATATRVLTDLAGVVDLKPRPLDDLMASVCGRSWAFSQVLLHDDEMGPDDVREADEELNRWTSVIGDLLETPRYRLLRRQALIQQARQLVSQDDEGDGRSDS